MTSTSPVSLIAIQIAACLGFLVVQLDVSVVNVALGALKDAFDTNLTGLQWVINSYALVFSALLILGGALGDKSGARAVFVSGFIIFTVASAGCGMASSMAMLIAMRCLQGVGAAMLLPTSLTVIRISFEDPVKRATAVATWGACGGLALAAGPVLGGLMIEHLGWRSVFFLNIPIGVAAIGLILRCAPRSPRLGKKLDVPGQISSAVCLAALTYALTESSSQGWTAAPVAALLGAVLSGIVFVLVEKKVAFPMLPRRLSANRVLATASLCGAVINMTFYGTVFALSIYYQTVLHYSAFKTGVAFIPLTAVLTISTMVSSRIARRVSATSIITFGFLLQCLGYLALSRLTTSTSTWWLNAALISVGIGSAVSVPSITNSMLLAVSKHDAGMASGLMASARQMGGVIGVAVFGGLISQGETASFMRGMSHAMLFAALSMLTSVFIILRVRPGKNAPQGT
jgi:DHA2 family methylenomycin A resistance protein-like MFS transporter